MAKGAEAPKPGDQVLVDMFKAGERVDVVANGRGKGFQGVMKRHGFSGGAATHGSMFHRAPGSIGAPSYPSRVVKGMRMGGRMGGKRITTSNLTAVSYPHLRAQETVLELVCRLLFQKKKSR